MAGDRYQLTNFVHKFFGTVKFGNDHIAKIMRYGDYQIGNITISRVYYVEGLGHNLFFVGQFCDSYLEVAFRKHTCFVRNLEALDEGYSSKNYVRKFLRALHPKCRANVTTIEESKYFSSLSLNELIENLKDYEMIIKKDSEIVKAKVKRKSLALKAKKESSDERVVSTSGEEDDEMVKNETCLVAQASSEGQICDNKVEQHSLNMIVKFLKDGKVQRKVKESLNVTFDETHPPSKYITLVDDDIDEEESN
ncbi:hypothetical protein Tco_1156159 [Tanacetum coccineum]